ncbi:MAG: hypothetical protein JW993_18210 [Sedimentisphaerales bacterium]|nr:hypothetical protein [Sedimentisphaerales bacterium]
MIHLREYMPTLFTGHVMVTRPACAYDLATWMTKRIIVAQDRPTVEGAP